MSPLVKSSGGESDIAKLFSARTFRYKRVLYFIPYTALFLFLGCYSLLPFFLVGGNGIAQLADFPFVAKMVLLAGPAFALFGIIGNFRRWHPIKVSEVGIAACFREHLLISLMWVDVKCVVVKSERDFLQSKNRMVFRVKGRSGDCIQFEEGITGLDALLSEMSFYAKRNNIEIISPNGTLSLPFEM